IMKRTFLIVVVLSSLCGLTIVGQQPPTAPPPSQSSQGEIGFRITGGTGMAPRLAIVPFVALSQDAETVAAAKTIGDILYDDIAYEREFYLIAKDAIATIPPPASLDEVHLERWEEANADELRAAPVRTGG